MIVILYVFCEESNMNHSKNKMKVEHREEDVLSSGNILLYIDGRLPM